MPAPLQPRNNLNTVMHPPIVFRTGNEQGTVVYNRRLTPANEESVSHDNQEIHALNEDSGELPGDISDVGVDGREELGRVSDGSPQELLGAASNYPLPYDRQETIEIHQKENGEGATGLLKRPDLIEELQKRGHGIVVIQTAMNRIWSEKPNSNFTPEAVDREIQRLQDQAPGQEESEHIVMVGDVSNMEDMKKMTFENQYLRERSICKVCRLQNISIAFFPCCHLVCCTGCFVNIEDRCNICKQRIDYGLEVQQDV